MFLALGSRQLTHELLVTFLAEVSAIVNCRPITTVNADKDEPQPLSPSMLLTLKARPHTPIPGEFIRQDVYAKKRWKRIQYLCDQFWTRWQRDYVQNLQPRSKWINSRRNLSVGDIVIVKDVDLPKYSWPLAIISKVDCSTDGKVRKATATLIKEGQRRSYERPITQFILLVENNESAD